MPKHDDLQTPQRRQPLTPDDRHGYMSYRDVRGPLAEDISVAMGIDEESGIKHTGHLVELRESPSHTRLSAHATTYAREVFVYDDQSVITVDLDRVKKEAVQTVYSPNGDIEVLKAGWSYEQNGYHGPYERVSISEGNDKECKAEWEKYEGLIARATEQSISQEAGRKK